MGGAEPTTKGRTGKGIQELYVGSYVPTGNEVFQHFIRVTVTPVCTAQT